MSLRLLLAAASLGIYCRSVLPALALYWAGIRIVAAIELNAARILQILREAEKRRRSS
jgi:hypothetical protein